MSIERRFDPAQAGRRQAHIHEERDSLVGPVILIIGCSLVAGAAGAVLGRLIPSHVLFSVLTTAWIMIVICGHLRNHNPGARFIWGIFGFAFLLGMFITVPPLTQ